MRWGLLWGLAALLVVVAAPVARADSDYEDENLGLRLASAFIRFTEVSAFGAETAANRWSPAVNPATADWTCIDRPVGVVLAGYWSRIDFDQGNTIDIFGETGLWDTRRAGTVHVTLSQLRSNEEPDRQGLVFDYETDTVLVQWAKRVRNWSAGLAFNYAKTTLEQSANGVRVNRNEAETYRIRAGGLWEPNCGWLVGLVAEYGWTPYDFEVLVPTPIGPQLVTDSDTQEQYLVRTAVSYEYSPLSVAFLDYQWSYFENERGDMTIYRFSGGVQQNVFRFLFVRAGLTTDQHGNLGAMAGIGAALGRTATIDFGYQYGMLPELEPEFGEAQTFQLAVSVRF